MAKSKKVVQSLDNFLIPEHRVLSEEEAAKLLSSLSVEKSKLPKILINDPALRDKNVNVGDVIEIKRKDPVGEYNYYRVVVDSK